MAVTSAVGLGMLVVFLVGTGLTFLALDRIAIRIRIHSARQPGPIQSAEPGWLSDENRTRISFLGGGLTVGLLILSLFILPRSWFIPLWSGLTILGILAGIATFFINRPAGAPRPGPKPPPYLPPVPQSPPAQEDPYQELLARVKHDRGLAERLIAYERKRRPGASLEELCRWAIERLEHDNR